MKVHLAVDSLPFESGVILRLNGKLTYSTQNLLADAINRVLEGTAKKVALDFSGISYIDSKGLQLISKAVFSLKEKKLPLFAYGMNSDILEILKNVDLGVNVKILKNEKEF